MTTDDIKIKLFPYLGYSEKLIEFFAIIGYEEETINRFLLNENKNQEELEMTFLSIVISNFSFEIADDYIIKQVYPDKPIIIESGMHPNESSIIFSSCIDSENGTKKIFSCYALRFYEKIKTEDEKIYYVPKAFLIYSQYPYFSTFRAICKKVLTESKEQNLSEELPIEIFIYCLVNYIPSPINYGLELNDFKPKIYIPRLTAYPYVDFNLGKILSSINLIDFIKIFILIFLELDLLFFSPRLNKLNIFMFALYILNYPLTDSIYFWHIKTISLEDIKNGFGDKDPSTTFKGVNASYNPDIDLSDFKVTYFVIDIENKKEPIKKIDDSQEANEINLLLNYINNLLSGGIHSKKSYFLGKYLTNFHKNLKSILKEYNEYAQNDLYIKNDYFCMNESIKQINRKIQEAFYDFVLNILVELNNDFKLNMKSENKNNEKNNAQKISEKEKLFIEYTKNAVKYGLYFQNFLTDFNVYDGIKISLLFSDEYVNLKKQENYNDIEGKVKYFDLMDKLYILWKKNNFSLNINCSDTDYSRPNYIQSTNQIKYKNSFKLFNFDKDIIRKFIYKKKNKNYYKKLKEPEEIKVETINKNSLIFTIHDYFSTNNLFTIGYYIRSSIAYIISICFALFQKKIISFIIIEYLNNSKKIKYFERYFIFVVLKAINLYYKLNKKERLFPEMIFENVKVYYEIIQNYLDNNSIIKDEELSLFFKKNLIEEKGDKSENINSENKFIYKYDEDNYYDDINEIYKYLKINQNEIIVTIGYNLIKCKKIDNNVDKIFLDIFSYYEFFLSKDFDVKKLDINLLFQNSVNFLIILNSYKEEVNLKKILFYSIRALFSFKKQLENYKSTTDDLNNA